MEKKKLSLEAFKAKANQRAEEGEVLSRISGGILGSCHVVCNVSYSTFYYAGGSGNQTCTVCTTYR